ncbi:hypothetical protein [Candidatus Hakubella thermalkaliphila]|uniref:hypothetical protein n=1 Tax=Candidatus Hakubella thermalkaliphila TaxID=2754717 RepID=UPI0015934834|nr:hypothetical protein [Candidatus Hakubella thermalkaliphila]
MAGDDVVSVDNVDKAVKNLVRSPGFWGKCCGKPFLYVPSLTFDILTKAQICQYRALYDLEESRNFFQAKQACNQASGRARALSIGSYGHPIEGRKI